jgi:hypothetical protein
MATRKPAQAAVTSPDEGQVSEPAEGEKQTPDEGQVSEPAEGEQAAPAEGEQAPAEGEQAAPAEGEQAPAEGDSAEPEVTKPETTEELLARLTSQGWSEPVNVEPTTVVMQIAITGTRDGEPWPRPGEEITLPADEADRMVRLGYASPVD